MSAAGGGQRCACDFGHSMAGGVAACERRVAACVRRAEKRAAQGAWTFAAPRIVRGRRPDAPRLPGTVARPTLAAEARAARQAAYFAAKAARS